MGVPQGSDGPTTEEVDADVIADEDPEAGNAVEDPAAEVPAGAEKSTDGDTPEGNTTGVDVAANVLLGELVTKGAERGILEAAFGVVDPLELPGV